VLCKQKADLTRRGRLKRDEAAKDANFKAYSFVWNFLCTLLHPQTTPPTHVLGLLQHGSCFCLTTEIWRLAFRKLQCQTMLCTTGRIAASNSGTGRNELFKAQWSLYVQPSGHHVYSPVVTICTVLWSINLQPSGHCTYSAVVTICTGQWSSYVQPSGHHMYSPVVTVCTAQWSLYLQPSGHYMYSLVVTVCTE